MRFPKELAAVFAAGVLSVSLCACGQPAAPEPEQTPQASTSSPQATVAPPVIQKDGVLRVAVLTGAGRPEVMEASDGSYSGLDVDVASALAKQMGLKVELVPAASVADAKAAGVDVVLGVTSKTADGLTVVSSYMEEALALFGRGTEVQEVKASDVNGKTVAVVTGSAAAAALAGDSGLQVVVRDYASVEEAFKAMADGDADYVACGAYEGGYLTTQYANTVFCGTVDVPTSVGAGVDPVSKELVTAVQDALDTVSSNGVLSVVRSRWVGSMPVLGADTQVEGVTVSSTGTDAASNSASGASDSQATEGSTSGTSQGTGSADAAAAVANKGQAITGDGSSAGSNAVTSVD